MSPGVILVKSATRFVQFKKAGSLGSLFVCEIVAALDSNTPVSSEIKSLWLDLCIKLRTLSPFRVRRPTWAAIGDLLRLIERTIAAAAS